jgi:dipeptidyl aminopeptidase/acylaminoacyl peptidase
MGSKKNLYRLIVLSFGILFCISCKTEINQNVQKVDHKPDIEPDYSDVTIPPNIAPMNFYIREEGDFFNVIATSGLSGYQIKIKSYHGMIRFPEKSWRKLLNESQGDTIEFRVNASKNLRGTIGEYKPFYMIVARDKIDPYLVYRLIHPGYYSWSNIKIVQRSLESFSEESIIENQIIEKNCVNCHSFNNNNADRFMIHIRGSLGGTYFVDNGNITRTDPKIDAMPGGATYPSWHPEGRYVAFSSNQVRQSFYSLPGKNIEVFDLVSSLILYDRKNNEIISITDRDTTKYLQTFPSWSPDGKYLYFCRALQTINSTSPDLEQIKNTHYDLARKSFDTVTRAFGETETVFNASEINKSASFPRISPDGKYLIFTLADYGTFPIWHREADLYLLDLQTGIVDKMDINSDETESYHSWSSNGKWLVFSSKRIDGRSARPYFAHIDSLGSQGKEFVLPQKDPSLYSRMLESFNLPELVNGRIKIKPRDFANATRQEALKAKSENTFETIQGRAETKKDIRVNEKERPIHE